MMLSTFLLTSLLVVATATPTLAAPSLKPAKSNTYSIDLKKRNSSHPRHRNSTWAALQASRLQSKYSPNRVGKRATGENDLTNLNQDSTYFGSIAVGSPAQPFDVILDTGSSDLWLAGVDCATCGDAAPYDPAVSSSSHNLQTSFSITYGSGDAAGALYTDNVQMAGFLVPGQVLAAVQKVSSGILENSISGLLGLAWTGIASSGATPLVQALAQQSPSDLDAPQFGFFLTRFEHVLTTEDDVAQFGGQFTIGAANDTFYDGNIEFQPIPAGKNTFWTLAMTEITVQGNQVPITPGEQYAAIDTGTTLLGGPKDMIAAVYAQIPGSQPGTGDLAGYYTYPCNTNVQVTLSFGGKQWPINPADFMLMEASNGQCVGALFTIALSGSNAPSWIVGDTFLKSVYSVFRFAPPSVGFAALSTHAKDLSVVGQALPTATVVADPIEASQASTEGVHASTQQIGAAPRAAATAALLLPVLFAVVGVLVL